MKRTPLRRVGKKARKDRAELRTVRAPDGPCEAVMSLMCTGRAEVWHHKLRRSQGGHNHPSNLLAVCAPCHRVIHDNPAESYARGFLVHSWDGNHDDNAA